jgi:predicted  nucleic acid-binding Zn-ribbon protein
MTNNDTNGELLAKKDDKIFELNQEISRLRGQVTYLQEELYSAEDNLDMEIERYESKIADLEQQLGNALFGG